MTFTRVTRRDPAVCCACGNVLPIGARVFLWVANRRKRAACGRVACFDVALGLARVS